jgi:hypothetical protein
MKPGESAEVFENETSKYWFEEDILFVISKKGPPRSFEQQKKETDDFITNLNGKKVCAMIDITHAAPSSPEAREYNKKKLPEIFKAIAFITHTALGRMLINLYLGMRSSPFPTRVFSNENEALSWLQQFR